MTIPSKRVCPKVQSDNNEINAINDDKEIFAFSKAEKAEATAAAKPPKPFRRRSDGLVGCPPGNRVNTQDPVAQLLEQNRQLIAELQKERMARQMEMVARQKEMVARQKEMVARQKAENKLEDLSAKIAAIMSAVSKCICLYLGACFYKIFRY